MGRYLTPSGGGADGGSSSMRNQRHVITANTPALPIPAWAKSMRVSGCSGGQGGWLSPGTEGKQPGGACGYYIDAAQVPLPAGAETLAVVIGSGGLGRSSGSGPGALGGITSIAAGGQVWKIAPVGDGSAAGLFDRDDLSWNETVTDGYASPYGAGGISAAASTDNGGNASGFGGGGGSGHGTHGGNGSPGMVIIEFLEAA